MPKISQLPAAVSVGAADLFAIVQSSVTKKATASLVLSYIQTNITVPASQITGVLALANGGTAKALTASNGGIIYSDADSMEVLAGTATAGQILRSGVSSAPSWSTATYATTYAASDLVYSNGANTVAGLATAASSVLRTNSSGVPAWSGAMTDGQVIIGVTSGTPTAATLTPGTGINITPGAGSITIAASGSGSSWTDVTGTTQAMVANNGYTANNAGTVTLTLPATASYGTAISVIGKGAGGWLIAQNASQSIRIGSATSTVGAGGSIASTNAGDSIELICTTANTVWSATGAPQSAGLTIV